MPFDHRAPGNLCLKPFHAFMAMAILLTFAAPARAQISFTRLPGAIDPAAMADDPGEDHAPQVATDNQGHWVAVWSTGMELPQSLLHISRSTDAGLNWSSPVALASPLGIARNPQIATDGKGAWVCVWIDSASLESEGDIYYARSTDNGETWSEALNLCADSDTGDDSFPRIVADPNGAWVAAWETTEPLSEGGDLGDDIDIVYVRSTDGGATWSAPLPLNTTSTADADADDRCIDLTTLGQGNWLASWFSVNPLDGSLGSDEDILFARSTDDGQTWSAPAALNNYAAGDDWIDITPRLTNDGQGNVACAWVSAESWMAAEGSSTPPRKALYVSRSSDHGQTWQTAVQIKDDLGTPDVFNETPAIHTDGSGLWLAAWSLEGGSLYLFLSTDQGGSWTAVPYLYVIPSSLVRNWNVSLTCDSARNWVIAWDSNNPLAGTLQEDQDIFVSAFSVASSGVPHETWRMYE